MSNVPETSIAAYRSLEPQQLNEIYRQILKALEVINEGTFEEIAAYLKVDKSRVWKRMSELERMELVYRPGNKRLLKSNRQGFTWMLRNPQKTEDVKRGTSNDYKNQTSASQFANNILKQADLFQ